MHNSNNTKFLNSLLFGSIYDACRYVHAVIWHDHNWFIILYNYFPIVINAARGSQQTTFIRGGWKASRLVNHNPMGQVDILGMQCHMLTHFTINYIIYTCKQKAAQEAGGAVTHNMDVIFPEHWIMTIIVYYINNYYNILYIII